MIPRDTLNQIGVLKRREIEARVLGPFVEALSEQFPRAEVIAILQDTIVRLARAQGAGLAAAAGRVGLESFAGTLDAWTRDGALELEVLEQSTDRFSFNVTRCRYAEMYRALGIPELGAVLSCSRDASLIEGFDPAIEFSRTQTIMEGAAFCDFRYRRKDAA